MTAVGKHLQIPTLATEQYPKAFGATVSEGGVDWWRGRGSGKRWTGRGEK